MERSIDQNRAAGHASLQRREKTRTQDSAAVHKTGNGAADAKSIYGGNLVTEQERNASMTRQQAEMQKRSKERNIPIAVTPE